MALSAKNSLPFITCVLLTVILAASSVHGAVYMWRNAAGVACYTNNQDDIPARYKLKAKVLYPDQVETGSALQNAPVQQPGPAEKTIQTPVQQPSAETRQTMPIITAPLPAKAPPPLKRERRKRSESTEE